MNITPEQIIKASKIGLGILSRPDVPIPASFIDDVQVIRAILAGIAAGQIVVGKPAKKADIQGPS